MDELVEWLLVALAIGVLGGLLGIIGFFRANGAMREVRQLRTVLAALQAGQPVAPPPPTATPADAVIAAFDAAETPSAPAAAPLPSKRDWEALLTAKWGVWLGAAALMMAGVFLVRYASDQGLLGPGTRCLAAVGLGAALIAMAEWLRRRSSDRVSLPDYAPGGLAAGGVAVLFAAAYMAGPLYALAPAPVAFGLLAAAALSGLALSLRMGPLVAAVGLVGAFVTPFLVATADPSVPGLFAYLLLVAAAALAVVRYTAWTWLGWATTIACAAFVAAAAINGPGPQSWAPGLFVPMVMLLVLLLLPAAALDHGVGRRLAYLPLAALGAAGLLLAFAAPDAATRAGVLLLAPLTIGKAATEPRLDRLPWLAALLFLLLIAGWGLPPWRPSGEAVTAGGVVIAVLPGGWAPPVLRALLLTAAGMAALFAAAGLWGERRRPDPLRWSALPAAVPVLTVAVLYARVSAFQPDDLWAGTAVAVAALSTFAAYAAAREGSIARAGAHAAGATAALALGCGAVLSAQWLTVALSLFLPALAAIEHQAKLPALRRVALAVAALAGARLLLNPAVLNYADGQWLVLNGLLAAYGAAAVAFAVAARMFRRGADDLVVAVLELGSAAFTAALVLLEVRQWATDGHLAAAGSSFREAAMDVSALSVLSLFALYLQLRGNRPMLGLAARVGGGLALFGGVALLLANPAFFADDTVGGMPLLNALVPAYLIPAAAALAARRFPTLTGLKRPLLLTYALLAIFAYVTLAVRHGFHPHAMALDDAPVEDAELWAWSGAWLLFGGALMGFGVLTGRKALRLAALAIVGLTGAKVFLIDMSGLIGLWRVLSFLGLGLTLIGLGVVHRRFVAIDLRRS